jgi:hypothetical protein
VFAGAKVMGLLMLLSVVAIAVDRHAVLLQRCRSSGEGTLVAGSSLNVSTVELALHLLRG